MLTPPDLPGPSAPAAPTDDELFAQIVAGFSQEAADPIPRWPVSEDLSDEPEPPRRRRADQPRDEDQGLPGWLEPAALEDDGHYEPPPAPKVPRLRVRTVAALLTTLLGFAVLFVPTRVGLDDDAISVILGLLLTGGGAGLLVYWMRDAPPTDSGWDDGAVV